jgi:hypothetical protein
MTTRTRGSLLAVAVASIAAFASGRALAADVWTFAKSPAPWAPYAISPGPSVEAMAFNVTATTLSATSVKRMTFLVTGTAQNADVANFQLVFYPYGLAGSGYIVGSSSASGFSPGLTTSLVAIDLSTPLALPALFTGAFALRVDVNGVRSFRFQPQLRTVTVESNGVVRNVAETDDLPLPGDSFYVN